MTELAVRCHGSTADASGHQVSCPEIAWASIPWRSADCKKFQVPLCFEHTLRFLREEAKTER